MAEYPGAAPDRADWRQLFTADGRTRPGSGRRWVQTCKTELLDRTLIWDQHHLLYALREFETFYNSHRPHQGIANARPLHALPAPIDDPGQIAHLEIRRRARLGGILHEYQHAA